MIPCAWPKAQYLAQREEILAAMERVLDSGTYILGEEVAAFEREFAAWTGSADCVGVANGTDAITLALRALDIGPGDEVVTTSLTAVATIAAIERAGATPVLADIEPDTLTLDPESAARAVTPRTKAIVPVHLYGHLADIPALLDLCRRRGLVLIEDCAQAHGARLDGKRAGTFGRASCFSFYPTKNLGALGDGGAVLTDDPRLATRLRSLREYGWENRVSMAPGLNSRLDELQAAILRVKLARLDEANADRARIAAIYNAGLAGLGLELPACRDGVAHAYHLYVVRSPRRDELLAHLRANGVGAAVHYALAAHQQPAYARLSASLPITERATASILSLPLYPGLTEDEAQRVVEAVRNFFA